MTLSEILERLEKAEGPSAALARQIQCTLGGWHRVEPRHCRGKHGAYISPDEWIGRDSDGAPILDSLHGTTMHRDVPDCTASLDAAVALVERVLPDWTAWELASRQAKKHFRAELSKLLDDGSEQYVSARHNTPALALCTALVKALIDRES